MVKSTCRQSLHLTIPQKGNLLISLVGALDA